jgi:hypothetical protein
MVNPKAEAKISINRRRKSSTFLSSLLSVCFEVVIIAFLIVIFLLHAHLTRFFGTDCQTVNVNHFLGERSFVKSQDL